MPLGHLLCNFTGRVEKIDKSIDWNRIEDILLSHYTVGTSGEGADAYPPLLLFKCMLLQKWFRINSDPELENQINDRLSFKKFLGLSLSKPSQDHSTFSRFRSRLSKIAIDQINSEILRQFEAKGLSVNEGIAVDARLVKSASRTVSNEKLKLLREQSDFPESKLKRTENPRNFLATWTRIGSFKRTFPIMASRNMPQSKPITDLSWLPR